MDAKKQTALGPLDSSNRMFPYPSDHKNESSDNVANAHSHQDSHAAQPNGQKM